MTAITALTAQNTTGVAAVVEMPPDFVGAQIDAVVSDIGVDAAKTGMLSSAAIIERVAAKIREHRLMALVVDPVMIAKSGAALLRPEAREALQRILLPLALVITPNLLEAGALLGRPVRTLPEMEEAARALHALGPHYTVVKGGHLDGDPVDVVFDGRRLERLEAHRIATPYTHGTGCIFSAAIAAGLAQRRPVPDAIREAKIFVTRAIAAGIAVGAGHGPANPMHACWPPRGRPDGE